MDFLKFRRPRMNQTFLLFIMLGLFNFGCLNSSKSKKAAGSSSSKAEGVSALSPWTVQLSWDAKSGVNNYVLYSVNTVEPVRTDLLFTNTQLTFDLPGTYQELKLYPSSNGNDAKSKPHKSWEFTMWGEFKGQDWTLKSKPRAGLEVSWDYVPWEVTGALPEVTSESSAEAQMQCYFASTIEVPAAELFTNSKTVVVRSALSDRVLNAGVSVEPSKEYRVGCEVVYGDGKTSRSDSQRTETSDAVVSDSAADGPVLSIDEIQVSRAISVAASKVSGGTLNLLLESSGILNENRGSVYTFQSQSGLSNGTNIISLPNAFDNKPSADIFGGKFILKGTFQKEGEDPVAVASKQFYVKSADRKADFIYTNVGSAQASMEMGAALAAGDFDCDGNDDLAVGLPSVSWRESSSGKVYPTGVVVIYYGTGNSANPLFYGMYQGVKVNGSAPSFTPKKLTLPDSSSVRVPFILVPEIANGTVIDPNSGARFGETLAVGNFNRDLFARDEKDDESAFARQCMDLAIGAPGEKISATVAGTNPDFGTSNGSVYIKYGSPSGFDNSSGWKTYNKAFSMTLGSCNPGEVNSLNDTVFPKFSGTPAFDPADTLANNGKKMRNYEVAPSSSCVGTRIFSHTIERDGTRNECVGVSGPVDCEASTVNGAFREFDENSDYYRTIEFSSLSNGSKAQENGNTPVPSFGLSLASGDLNSDGYDDLMVGSPFATQYILPKDAVNVKTIAEAKYAGEAFAYFGSSSGIYTNPAPNFEGAGAAPIAFESLYAANQKNTAAQFSPIKFVLGRATRLNDQFFGASVAIVNFFITGTPTTEDNHSLVGNTRDNDDGESVYAVIGAPGFALNKGLVSFVKLEKVGASPHLPAVYHIEDNSADYAEYHTAANANVFRRTFEGEAASGGENWKSEFGAAMTVGSLRSPRLGVDSNLSMGLGVGLRTPIRQVLVVGAPGANNTGRIYSFATLPSGSMETFKNTNLNRTLCDSASSCPGSVLDAPTGANRFGSRLAVIKTPLAFGECTGPTCKGVYLNENWGGKLQPMSNDNGSLDVLLASALSPTGGTAYLYETSVSSGLSSTHKTLRPQPSLAENSAFGAGLAGGYFVNINTGDFDSNPISYHAAVGDPLQSALFIPSLEQYTSVPKNGSVHLFLRDREDNFQATSGINLAVETTDSVPNATNLSLSIATKGAAKESRMVGDLNCDGFADLVMPYDSSTKRDLLILYGSKNGLVTKKADGSSAIPVTKATSGRLSELGALAPQWIDTVSFPSDDKNPLQLFAGVGDVNGDRCGDLLVMNTRPILIFGSQGGLVMGQPALTSNNLSPQFVRFPDVSTKIDYWSGISGNTPKPRSWNYDDVGDNLNNPDITSALWDPDSGPPLPADNEDIGKEQKSYPLLQPALSTWNTFNQTPVGTMRKPPLCHGDFNGDGYSDIAIGSNGNHGYKAWGRSDYTSSANQVFNANMAYAAAINTQFFVFYGGSLGLQLVYSAADYNDEVDGRKPLESACLTNKGCRPGMIFDPLQFINDGDDSDPNNYFPYKYWRDSHFRRYSQTGDTDTALVNRKKAIYDRFGENCESIGDIDGDGFDDLLVPMPHAQGPRAGSFMVFRGGVDGLKNSPYGSNKPSVVSFKVQANEFLSTGSTRSVEANTPQLLGSSSAAAKINIALKYSMLGISAAGLGNINNDFVDGANGRYPLSDFVLGAPGLVEYGAADPTESKIRTGGLVSVYGRSDFFNPPQDDHEIFTSADWNMVALAPDNYVKIYNYFVCDRPGIPCVTPGRDSSGKDGHLIWPNEWNLASSSPDQGVGNYVDAAGDVNGDGNHDLLVSLPELSPDNFTAQGASIIFFGHDAVEGSIDVGWGSTVSGTVPDYTLRSPTQLARCQNFGAQYRCLPMLVVPEFAKQATDLGQRWIGRGGMIFHPSKTQTKFFHSDFGSRNTFSLDLPRKTSDLMLTPTQNFPHPAPYQTIRHFGGIILWQ